MQPRKRERSLTFEYLNQNKLLDSTETVIVKYDSTSRLCLCHSNIFISGLSGSICVDVPKSLSPPCSLFKRHLFHSVWVWILKRCTEGTTWTCSCTAAIFRAAQKRLERNVRPTCGPVKIILQQKDFWNYKYFPLRRTGSQCWRGGAQGPRFWGPAMT